MLLTEWAGRKLFCVDPWRNFDTRSYHDTTNVAGDAQERLRPFGARAEMIRKTSSEAASAFADGSLDFVYIDAQHHYEAVVEDLELWVSKVRPGGVIAGHDYLDGEISGTLFGVKRAVDEFAARTGQRVIASLEPDFPSWLIVKTSAADPPSAPEPAPTAP